MPSRRPFLFIFQCSPVTCLGLHKPYIVLQDATEMIYAQRKQLKQRGRHFGAWCPPKVSRFPGR